MTSVMESRTDHISAGRPRAKGNNRTPPSNSSSEHPPATPPRNWVYFCWAVLWALALFYLGQVLSSQPLGVVLASVLVLSVPLLLSGLYLTTIGKILALSGFARHGRIYGLFSGRLLAIIAWTAWALITTFFMLLQFQAYSPTEWAAFFLVIPLFLIIYRWSHRLLAAELKPYLVSAMALIWARRITPVIALFIYMALVAAYADVPTFDSLGDAIRHYENRTNRMVRSALIFELAHYQAYFNGVKYFFLDQIGGESAFRNAVLLFAGGFVVFFNACAMLSCFLIPRSEYRRLFARLSEAEKPPPAEVWRMALMSLVITFLILFVFIPGFSSIEQRVRSGSAAFSEAREVAGVLVVQIDDHFYRANTQQELADLQAQTLREMAGVTASLHKEASLAFDKIELNVDNFLDWYYSLTTEYLRTINLLMGSIEEYLATELDRHLRLGDPFRNLERKIKEAIEVQESLKLGFQQEVQELLDKNRIYPTAGKTLIVTQRLSLPDITQLTINPEFDNVEPRLAASAGAGVVTALIATKVAGKVSAKGALKTAGVALGKMIGKQAVGTASGASGGAVAGAAIGSVVPGAGTAVGAVVGGVLGGIAVGLAVDKTLLELDEYLNRDAFKAEIVESIREVRSQYLGELLPQSTDAN